MPVTMPGSAIGRMTSSEIASLPKKFELADGRGAERAEDQRDRRRDRRRPARESAERRPDVRPVPGDREPLQRQARRRPLIALLLGREGIDEDQQDRQVQEEQPAAGGELQGKRRCR